MPRKKQILTDVSGYCKSGMMVALMGATGAGKHWHIIHALSSTHLSAISGKTTLLDVLASRKTGGYIAGELLVNGHPKDKFFNRMVRC